MGGSLPWAVLLPLVTLPLAVPLLREVRDFEEPRELNRALKGTARLSLWHSLAFAAGLALSGLALGGPAA
jgi:1,4-dihydroxy-2-naphthoate octaprenyltransferase